MLRRTKQEVLSELPEKTFQTISLPRTPTTEKLVAEEFKWDEKSYGRVALNLESGELSSHRQELAIAKIPQITAWICEVLQSERKVVIFAYHREVIKQLRSALDNYNPVVIEGSSGMNARNEAVCDFQTDPTVRVFIGQIKAAGVGITLTAASHVIFVEPDWTPGVVHQAVDRCHRIGQKSAVLAQFLVVEGSLEERMMQTLIDKTKIIKTIVEKPSDHQT
jgi:SWI/SNF-related matrix-associated actin-dependent regulator 1 of chromatin subfamily A